MKSFLGKHRSETAHLINMENSTSAILIWFKPNLNLLKLELWIAVFFVTKLEDLSYKMAFVRNSLCYSLSKSFLGTLGSISPLCPFRIPKLLGIFQNPSIWPIRVLRGTFGPNMKEIEKGSYPRWHLYKYFRSMLIHIYHFLQAGIALRKLARCV